MPEPLVPSADLLRRVLHAECQYTLSRLGVLERLPGNPVGVAYRRLKSAFAMSAQHNSNASFNRVVGLTNDQASEVPALVEWFESRKIVGRFEIMPGIPCPDVLAALAKCGYRHTDFHAVLFGRPQPERTETPDVTVEVVSASSLEVFLDCYSAGWGVPNPESFKKNVRGWLGQSGWTLYLARRSGTPAGGAILYIDGRTGYCADSAVDPSQRGHGIHRSLLSRRSADAAAAGADLLCAQAAYLSTSQRNMARAGLGLLCTKSIWMRNIA